MTTFIRRPHYDVSSHFVIPTGITHIQDNAFKNDKHIKTVSIPWTVTHIGKDVFTNSGITWVELPYSLIQLGKSAFLNCSIKTIKIDCPNLTTIQSDVFKDCINLEEVKLNCPELTIMGSHIFLNCTSLQSVTMTNCINLRNIGSHIFSDCTSLTDIVLPPNLIILPEYTFHNTSLASIELPLTLHVIEKGTFSDCHFLTHIHIPASVKGIHPDAFAYNHDTMCITYDVEPTDENDGDDPIWWQESYFVGQYRVWKDKYTF